MAVHFRNDALSKCLREEKKKLLKETRDTKRG